MKKYYIFYLLLVLLPGVYSGTATAQEKQEAEKKQLSFKDSLDGGFDLSDFIIHKKGFVPMPVIVTEPALGGFGGGLAPVFIQPNAPRELNGKLIPVPPNITAVFGGYTLNDSWAVGGARSGAINKWNIRYSLAGAYANVNMNYYFNLTKLDKDVEFGFNIKAIPVMANISKQLRDPRFTIGLQYMFMHSELEVNSSTNSHLRQKLNSLVGNDLSGKIGKLGIKLSYDSRDNTFTPNKGIKTYLTADWSNPLVGSDYKYGQFEGAFYYFVPVLPNLITGVRYDMQQSIGDQPFYIKPFVDMRGVPMARYQGKTTMLAELEERWDITRRWSLVLFGGAGKGFDEYSEFKDAEWAWSYGTGFRYLMARKLNLRMGVDLAMGPEGFTYYLVFGSSWLRQ